MKISCVYLIRNTRTNRRYIGASRNFDWRWFTHKSNLRCHRHKNRRMQRDWNKHGEKSFVAEILEYTSDMRREHYYIETMKPEYNIVGSKDGKWFLAEETRKRQSVASMGNQKFLGHTHSEETKKIMSLKMRGNRNGEGNKGWVISEDVKRRISESLKGNTNRKGKLKRVL